MVVSIHVHLIAAKHVLRYLKGTIDYGLRHVVHCEFKIVGYTDSNWASSFIDWKSTLGCCFSLGLYVISWLNRKQTNVALNKTKAEYIAACSSCSEIVWIQKLLIGMFDLELDATCIFCDNQRCINLYENPVFHEKSKNIDIKY